MFSNGKETLNSAHAIGIYNLLDLAKLNSTLVKEGLDNGIFVCEKKFFIDKSRKVDFIGYN
jgi:hypothetical protein